MPFLLYLFLDNGVQWKLLLYLVALFSYCLFRYFNLRRRFRLIISFLFLYYFFRNFSSFSVGLGNDRFRFVLLSRFSLIYIFLATLNLSKINLTPRQLTSIVVIIIKSFSMDRFMMVFLVFWQRRVSTGYQLLIYYVFVALWRRLFEILSWLRRLMVKLS